MRFVPFGFFRVLTGLCTGVSAAVLGALALGVGPGAWSVALAQDGALSCPSVAAVQGGAALCRTAPGATIFLDGEAVATASLEGWALVGFERKAPGQVTLASSAPGAAPLVISLGEQDYPESRIDNIRRAGSAVVYSDKELAHICFASHLKRAAFGVAAPGDFFTEGFILPAEGRRSGVYGSARIYNGDDANPRVHWGIDVAAPIGTPFVAPAGGVVTLADPNLFFEGGAVFLDHGQGVVSVFMHMDTVDVLPGDVLAQGDVVGTIGNTGRSTGPHLHWGVKVNNAYWIDPAQLMLLEPQGREGREGRAGGVLPETINIAETRRAALDAYAGGLAACFDK